MDDQVGHVERERLLPPGETRRPVRRRWIVAALIVVALVLGIWLYVRHGHDDGATAASPTQQAPFVSVVVPGSGAGQRIVSATGTLAARREMPVGVAGEGGLVRRVLVEPGQWVAAGQVLASVDRSVQIETAQSLGAQIGVAQSDLTLAQAELKRAQALVDRGFISTADVQRRIATRDAAAARVKVARAALGEQRARNAQLDIRAPAAGLVLTRQVEPGQIISPGSGTLFRLAMGGQMELRAQLAEGDLQSVHVGSRAQVTPVGGRQSFPGEVWQVSPVIDPQTRQGIARIALRYDPALRPGGFASAAIGAGSDAGPELPQSALLSDDKGNYVFIVDEQRRAQRRDVTLGDVTENRVVIAGGLTGNERVVLSAGAFLTPGQLVTPRLVRGGADRGS